MLYAAIMPIKQWDDHEIYVATPLNKVLFFSAFFEDVFKRLGLGGGVEGMFGSFF